MSETTHTVAPWWRTRLAEILPFLGHRNWIAVVDSAYPLQGGAGLEMQIAGEDMIATLEHLVSAIDASKHVAASIFVDAELGDLVETDAPGISAYRGSLDHLLRNRHVDAIPHEEIIGMINDAAAKFHVLILKTTFTLPYTSVFFRLECGYWDEEREGRLRSNTKTG